jgi:ferredoxin
MVLNEIGEKWIRDGRAKAISFGRAREVLSVANQAGLVHLTLYMPDHEIFAFCSCCSCCCCHDLQLVLSHGKDYILTKADYAAVDDHEARVGCGVCVERCQFGARLMDGGDMRYNLYLCRGCGLCATTCPREAIEMVAV